VTYKVSLSRLFKEQVAQIKEFDTIVNSKKVIQNIKETATDLEKMQRSGISLQTTRIQSKVNDTNYTVVYKVTNNPHDKLIARRIIRSK